MKYECDQSTVCNQTHQLSCIFQLLELDKEPSCKVQNTGMLFATIAERKRKRKKQSIMRWADVTATLRENISSPFSICTPFEAREKNHTNPHIALNTNLCVYCLSYSELASTSPSRLLANECHYRHIMITHSYLPVTHLLIRGVSSGLWASKLNIPCMEICRAGARSQKAGIGPNLWHCYRFQTSDTRERRGRQTTVSWQQERRDKTLAAATLIFQSFFTRRHIWWTVAYMSTGYITLL